MGLVRGTCRVIQAQVRCNAWQEEVGALDWTAQPSLGSASSGILFIFGIVRYSGSKLYYGVQYSNGVQPCFGDIVLSWGCVCHVFVLACTVH